MIAARKRSDRKVNICQLSQLAEGHIPHACIVD